MCRRRPFTHELCFRCSCVASRCPRCKETRVAEVGSPDSIAARALLAVADVYMDTTFKQGFNLGPFHFLMAQSRYAKSALGFF